ncbi:MAG: hypothetical protein GX621_04620, partial [Pirellulaceae bacterium]|nr:hypothetical protein [Pirellulaceae bacterium]
MIQVNDPPQSSFGTDSDPRAELGPLVLRVHGADCDGAIVRLQSPKCTIGSDPRCTLRLDTEGVRPVHCLVIRGDRATVVRRWSDDTRLNGSAFWDTELVPGDRLGAGPVDLEILELTGPPSFPQGPQAQESKEFPDSTKFSQKI